MTSQIGTVIYDYGRGLYANITNRCPCRCQFCIRDMTEGLGSADSLWLKKEPTVSEVIGLLEQWPLDNYDELVFCGYGEPMERLDDLLEIAGYVKENTDLQVRINTNGLSDLINEKHTAPLLEGLIDTVSVSLNQCDKGKYEELCRPKYGLKAFPALLRFTEEIKTYVPNVAMSIVNVIPEADIQVCKIIAEKIGVKLRIR